MTITLILTGPATTAQTTAADLLETLTDRVPKVEIPALDASTRDPATAIALASLMLSVPGAVLACLEIGDRLRKRQELAPKVEMLKTEIERTGGGATLRLSSTTISLADTPTDRILDALSEELKS